MNSMGSDHASEGVPAKRLYVLQSAPSHPLSAPDPHITLKLRRSDLKSVSSDEIEQPGDTDAWTP